MTQPDYSGIPAMAYSQSTRTDFYEVGFLLKDMKVEFIDCSDFSPLAWNGKYLTVCYADAHYKFVTRDQFLAPFREEYEKCEADNKMRKAIEEVRAFNNVYIPSICLKNKPMEHTPKMLTPENLPKYGEDNKTPIHELINDQGIEDLESRIRICDALNYHAEQVAVDIKEKLSKMRRDSFKGWSEEAIGGYLTACTTIEQYLLSLKQK